MPGDVKPEGVSVAASSPMPVPGDVIGGKYAIEAVVGRGGMSVVYRATHLELDRRVAIKVLSAAALLLPEHVVRLKREARAVSHIRSEHVVRVHDMGELSEAGVPYLVMEYVSGLDLAAVLARRGPLPVDFAAECIMQTCEALAEAHALGIVHRDLKPANLFLTESVDGSPRIKVLDFGISRMPPRHGLSSLTDPGTVLGTPNYMAPEQMEASRAVDARSDIWALGAILFELLIGRPPYTGDSLPQIFMKIMRSRAPRASSFRGSLPGEIDTIIGRCLAVDPADRWQTVAELAWALAMIGPPRAREAAARITRIFERTGAGIGTSPSHTGLPAITQASAARPARVGATKRVAAAFASTCALGAAGVFGVLLARGNVDAHASTQVVAVESGPVVDTEESRESSRVVPELTALAISPMRRPSVPAPDPETSPPSLEVSPRLSSPSPSPPAPPLSPAPRPVDSLVSDPESTDDPDQHAGQDPL